MQETGRPEKARTSTIPHLFHPVFVLRLTQEKNKSHAYSCTFSFSRSPFIFHPSTVTTAFHCLPPFPFSIAVIAFFSASSFKCVPVWGTPTPSSAFFCHSPRPPPPLRFLRTIPIDSSRSIFILPPKCRRNLSRRPTSVGQLHICQRRQPLPSCCSFLLPLSRDIAFDTTRR